MIFSRKQFLIASLLTFVAIVISYNYFDIPIDQYFVAHANTYDALGKELSIAGESQWYFIISIFGALFFHYVKKNEVFKNRFLFLLYANIFSGLLSLLLKSFFGRLRPAMFDHEGMHYGFLLFQDFSTDFIHQVQTHFMTLKTDYTAHTSFPSGHATTTFTLFTYMAILFPKYFYLWLTIALVTLSGRVLSTAHYLSDIMGGAFLGTVATLYIYKKMKHKLNIKGNL